MSPPALNRDESLHRYWITNSADDAKFAAVFAQLIIRGQRHGVHGFLVRIRDEVGAKMLGGSKTLCSTI